MFTGSHDFVTGSSAAIPAGGSVSMRRVYVMGDQQALIASLTNQALDPWVAPRVAITVPAPNTTTHRDHIAVAGTASDDIGVTRLVMNGTAVGVNGDGSWSAVIDLTPGHNTIMATASDASGQSGTASRTITYAPMLICTVPRLVGRTLSQAKKALRRANCRLGRVTVIAGRGKKTRVIAQAVPAGWQRPAGARIAITIVTARRH